MLDVFLMAVGFALLIKGADLLVKTASALAKKLRVSDLVIGLTVIAFGTSLPELATSGGAAYKKNAEIAVGNVVGSNIFNIFFILGVSAPIRPIPFEVKYNVDTGFLVFASFILFLCMFTGKKHRLDRWEAVIFLIMYFAYLWFNILYLGQMSR